VNSRTWLCIGAVAAAAPGVLRDVSVIFWKGGRLATTRIDDRFGDLAGRLPRGERIGFVTDVPGDGAGRRYLDALYALAPAMVLPGPDARLVVADVADPGAVARICARWQLRLVAQAAPGVALLERE
jgi:hypothetical protein